MKQSLINYAITCVIHRIYYPNTNINNSNIAKQYFHWYDPKYQIYPKSLSMQCTDQFLRTSLPLKSILQKPVISHCNYFQIPFKCPLCLSDMDCDAQCLFLKNNSQGFQPKIEDIWFFRKVLNSVHHFNQ